MVRALNHLPVWELLVTGVKIIVDIVFLLNGPSHMRCGRKNIVSRVYEHFTIQALWEQVFLEIVDFFY